MRFCGVPRVKPEHIITLASTVPLPTTARGNTYILLFTDRFSRHASMYAVTAADFTAAGTADILVHDYIKHYGCPKRLLSDNGPQFCSDLSDELQYPAEQSPDF